MKRYFIEIAYRGTDFHGWQSQPNAVSVQQTIEENLSTVLRRPVPITGAGRTDTGVHALQMFAHFDVEELPVPADKLVASLNNMCGKDIAIKRIFEVSPDLHARFSAISRTYNYFIHFNKDPFLSDRSCRSSVRLDVDAMNEAAGLLLETSDFTSFAKLHSDAKTNICKVYKAEWSVIGQDRIVFTIKADRFLRNMVRAVVGTLVEIGRGKMTLEGFRNVIEKKDRCAAGSSMPAHALFLTEVEYPDF